MKIRAGFVSNSSSSSFLVGARGKTVAKITFEIDIAAYATECFTCIEELDRWFKDYHGSREYWSERLLKAYNRSVELIREGYTVYRCDSSNESDDDISNILYSHSPNIISWDDDQDMMLVEDCL